MKLKSLKQNKTYKTLPKVDKYEFLWINDFWDGPINGMCESEGTKFFFDMIEESEDEIADGWFRKFGLVKLSEEELKTEIYWNNLFCKYVGTHYNFTKDIRNKTKPKAKHQWPNFYEKYEAEYNRNFEENEVVGWFKL